MTIRTHTIPLAALAENGVLAFDVDGKQYLVANVDGDLQAYSVLGVSAARVDRAAVAEGRVRCPLHGWPIDPVQGGCAAAERCRYIPLFVEIHGDEIRVRLPAPDLSRTSTDP